MGFRFSILAVISLSTVPSFHLSAQELPLNAGALFLVFPVGAQAVGMGQTAIAASGRSDAAFWNPAGLATLSDDEFALHTATPMRSGPPGPTLNCPPRSSAWVAPVPAGKSRQSPLQSTRNWTSL